MRELEKIIKKRREEFINNITKANQVLYVAIFFSSMIIIYSILRFKLFNILIIFAHITLIYWDIYLIKKNKIRLLKIVADKI